MGRTDPRMESWEIRMNEQRSRRRVGLRLVPNPGRAEPVPEFVHSRDSTGARFLPGGGGRRAPVSNRRGERRWLV